MNDDNRCSSYDCEKTLDELLEKGEFVESDDYAASFTPNLNPAGVELYSGHLEEMLNLVRCISRVAPLAGPSRSHGYLNPSIVFATKARSGQFDCLSDDEYDEALQAAELLASFWEDEVALDGLTLARNALVHAVLNDDDLRPKALSKTISEIATCHRTLEQAGA